MAEFVNLDIGDAASHLGGDFVENGAELRGFENLVFSFENAL